MYEKENFAIKKENIFAIPIIHYQLETAVIVHELLRDLKPDCIAVELPENMQDQLLTAAERLPDITVVEAKKNNHSIYYLVEPVDGIFEALRFGLENGIPTFCVDLDILDYPDHIDLLPDPYAIKRIGLEKYYLLCKDTFSKKQEDYKREIFQAHKLKELSLKYDKVVYIGGMAHIENVLKWVDKDFFGTQNHCLRDEIQLFTISDKTCREILANPGWFSQSFEKYRANPIVPPDRQQLLYDLYKESSEIYKKNTGNSFPSYNFKNIMKYVRNYSLLHNQLLPDLYQMIIAAKGCVDQNYAYETWALATYFPYLKNIDNLPEIELTPEQIWGNSKKIRFELKQKSEKANKFQLRKKDSNGATLYKPPSPFSMCSYPPEDLIVENFGNFLRKKGQQILIEENTRSIPFSTSLEEGIDSRETIRHWYEKKIFVKVKGKPPGNAGSVVIIFDEDKDLNQEKYPWCMTWIGEHNQESDMAFYGTSYRDKIVGPGISRCEYGGFMMTYPPRRLLDVWHDPNYEGCKTKAEVLLIAAIDYAIDPIIVYVASNPPRQIFKSIARRYGKKIVYFPIGQLSPLLLNKLRVFHVLDSHDKRNIADEYIF
ncbi:hypothetical protein BN1013_01765 [Candidatus Rubidus massiliensis]|nr:MAG: hypothetical protein BGO10_09275 [Chlamydia sp. 32-24]CDZ81232.1 hypothetical protein BN1013_01765 [Candidatus Rubidus massiliensis]